MEEKNEIGLLADFQIKKMLKENRLFKEGTFLEDRAKYCTYEIRVGHAYERLEFSGILTKYIPMTLGDGDIVEIEPGNTIKVIAEEIFDLPNDIYARVTTVGQIFSSGLAAENTYVDPGYSGPLYLTLHNITNRTLTLKVGSPLARVEFQKLQNPVEKPHVGFKTVRENFVVAKENGDAKRVLEGRRLDELVREMIESSIDEAVHKKYYRTEVILAKLHEQDLKLHKSNRFLRVSSAIFTGLIIFLFARVLHLGVIVSEIYPIVAEIFVAVVASLISVFINKKYLNPK